MKAAARVRGATERDVDAVAQIERLSFGDPWSRAAFASLFGHAHVIFQIAEVAYGADGADRASAERDARAEIGGYVVAWLAGDEAEIANVAVAPSLRGRGLGALLLDAALAEVVRRGAVEVFLEVRESNDAARRLYASRAFVEVGRRPRYYRHPTEDALVLRRDEPAPDADAGRDLPLRSQ